MPPTERWPGKIRQPRLRRPRRRKVLSSAGTASTNGTFIHERQAGVDRVAVEPGTVDGAVQQLGLGAIALGHRRQRRPAS